MAGAKSKRAKQEDYYEIFRQVDPATLIAAHSLIFAVFPKLDGAICFRVYAEGRSGPYFNCAIWPTRKDMLEFNGHLLELGLLSKGLRGFIIHSLIPCKPGQKPEKRRYRKCLGMIQLNEEDLVPSVVAHEATHAALFYCTKWLKIPPEKLSSSSDADAHNEEIFCDVVGHITEQIYRNWSRKSTDKNGGKRK